LEGPARLGELWTLPPSLSQPPPMQYDEYGFLAEDNDVARRIEVYEGSFAPEYARRLKRFETFRAQLREPGNWTQLKGNKLKALLRTGVPHRHRAEVWWSVLNCERRRQRAPTTYSAYLSEPLDPKVASVVECDLPRTFPNHRNFSAQAGDGDGRTRLRSVLHAFANHSPRINYCQGLNFIAALLLVVFEDEERAFWALVGSQETLDVGDYYADGMVMLRADLKVLTVLLQRKCPKVANHLRAQNIELITICSSWYITWFATSLPITTLFRVWDCLFFEGYKILFRISLGIFRRCESWILRLRSFEELLQEAKQWPLSMLEHDALLKASFPRQLILRRRELLQWRNDALASVAKEDELQALKVKRQQPQPQLQQQQPVK